VLALASHVSAQEGSSEMRDRPRLRDLGLTIGVYQLGPLNAITDVGGVRVGQVTIIRGDDVRTGVTVIVPHAGNMFQDKVAAAVYVYNAFGKLIGSTQVNELGELETPILLTNTLSVWDAAVALVDWMLALPGNEDVRSINPVVGETNDGWLNDIRGRHVKAADVVRALESAQGGPVAEGSVGAGTGTIALGWKGGIGTSSRKLPSELSGFTRRRARAIELRWAVYAGWRAGMARAQEFAATRRSRRQPSWLVHDCGGYRCAARIATTGAARQARCLRPGPGRKCRRERQRRLRHCVFDHKSILGPTFRCVCPWAQSSQRR